MEFDGELLILSVITTTYSIYYTYRIPLINELYYYSLFYFTGTWLGRAITMFLLIKSKDRVGILLNFYGYICRNIHLSVEN